MFEQKSTKKIHKTDLKQNCSVSTRMRPFDCVVCYLLTDGALLAAGMSLYMHAHKYCKKREDTNKNNYKVTCTYFNIYTLLYVIHIYMYV